MKINLKQEIKNLKGEVLKDNNDEKVTLGSAVSSMLLGAEEGGKMKLFVLAQKLFSQDSIDLDASDLALIKKVVSNTKIYNALVAGQCEVMLNEIKEDK